MGPKYPALVDDLDVQRIGVVKKVLSDSGIGEPGIRKNGCEIAGDADIIALDWRRKDISDSFRG